MVIIRPTASLAKRMKVKLPSNEEASSTRLGDWYHDLEVLENELGLRKNASINHDRASLRKKELRLIKPALRFGMDQINIAAMSEP